MESLERSNGPMIVSFGLRPKNAAAGPKNIEERGPKAITHAVSLINHGIQTVYQEI